MKEIRISYNEIIEIWRKTLNLLSYEQNSGYIDIYINYNNLILCTQILDGTQEYADFLERKIFFANKVIKYSPETIWTHNYCDNQSWGSVNNSIFIVEPPVSKRMDLFYATVLCDSEINFLNSTIYMVIWSGISSPCPEKSSMPTPFNTNQFSPGVAGWIKHEKPWAGQEVSTYIYLSETGVPQYACTAFAYKSIDDIVSKSNFKQIGNRIYTKFEFIEQIILRYSMNERIECYNNLNIQVTCPNSIPAKAVFHCGTLDEF